MFGNIRSQPRLHRRTTATLINELPVLNAKLTRDQTTSLGKLQRVVAVRRYRLRNAVRSKAKLRLPTLFPRRPHVGNIRFDEQRVIVKLAQLLNARRAWSNLRLRVRNVFQILATTRIRTVSRSHERERIAHAIFSHASNRVDEHRMPVAIAPVDRQSWAISLQLCFERRDQIPVLLIDRTDAAKHLVMLRDLEHPLARHVAPAQDVLEERNDIVHAFRSAERDY